MPVNLINESDLNAYLTDLVYQGEEEPKVYRDGNFKSIEYVRQNKDGIVKGILDQYVKHRLRSFLTDKEEPFLEKVEQSEDLPAWAQKALNEGRKVHRFDAQKMTPVLRENITTVRDFLYSAAESYVDKSLATAEHTKQNPTIKMGYLKTSNEYDTFEKALSVANKWHELMAKRAEQLAKNKALFEKSVKGIEFVMDLPDGMAAYKLTTAEALDFESEYMGHCVGKGSYDEGVRSGKIEIYSIRDKNGEPHATFEVGRNEIYQCKGKGNKAPVARYRRAVQEFVKQKQFDITGDIANIGLIRQDDAYYDIYHLPKGVVVKGDLDFRGQDITQLPDLSDVIVEGNFDCSKTQITSLQGAPQEVGEDFYCSETQITSLQGAPQEVGGDFVCTGTQITSLQGAPQKVVGSFDCSRTQITSLQGAPQEVGGDFVCTGTQIKDINAELKKWKSGYYDQKSLQQIIEERAGVLRQKLQKNALVSALKKLFQGKLH